MLIDDVAFKLTKLHLSFIPSDLSRAFSCIGNDFKVKFLHLVKGVVSVLRKKYNMKGGKNTLEQRKSRKSIKKTDSLHELFKKKFITICNCLSLH